MDQNFINAAFGLAAAVAGWFGREMWSAVKELKTDLSKLREELPKSYVAKDDYRRDIDELKDICKQIFDKLDHKADKQ
jgi:hypothetical protein